MSGNEFQFFLSCDINLPVTFKIERLEGKLSAPKPPDSAEGDCTIEDKKPELYVESLLYIDGAPFGLPMRTRVAIKDMVVRGAPAIAITAALSLAVEVSSSGVCSGTPNDAASFLSDKLDYLVSSCHPAAVNLSDAAIKLKEVVRKATDTASDAQAVYQTYIEAAEIMLEDDVASNKAIGHHGASLLQKQQANSNSLSVLTHSKERIGESWSERVLPERERAAEREMGISVCVVST